MSKNRTMHSLKRFKSVVAPESEVTNLDDVGATAFAARFRTAYPGIFTKTMSERSEKCLGNIGVVYGSQTCELAISLYSIVTRIQIRLDESTFHLERRPLIHHRLNPFLEQQDS
jgi:hypothetical protein